VPSSAFSHTVSVAASAGSAWRRMQQPEVWVGIGPIERVSEADVDDRGTLRGFRWDAVAAGRHWSGSARTTEASPGEAMRLSLRSAELSVELGAILTPEGTHCRLAVELTARPAGMMARLFWGLIDATIRDALAEQTAEFGRRLAE